MSTRGLPSALRWHDADLHKQESLFSSYPCEGLKDVLLAVTPKPQTRGIIPRNDQS